jgi:UDP-2,3-diacylglucosamine pyrophosphatase LpxH
MKRSNYIVFSDVHLGADLVHHVRPWTFGRMKELARVDRDLASMLDWYRANQDPDHPWTLVIAGDLVDFIGMSIAPGERPLELLNAEEREFGLGGTEGHAVLKMRAVAARHRLVFERLAAFLDDGNSLALVRGNHDVDFHWQAARDAFVQALVECRPRADESGVHASSSAAFVGRVEFYPWFYYVEGLLYVEHGHQYDAMCSYHHLLAPVSPTDPLRLSWSFSDILLRRVVRPTPGIGAEGHEFRGIVDYVRFALSLGIADGWQLFRRYAGATYGALERWRAHVGARAHALRDEHNRAIEQLSGRMRVGVEKLRALSALWPRPVTRGMWPVLRSMFIDRFMLVAALAAVVGVTALLAPLLWSLPISVGLLVVSSLFWWWSVRARALDLDSRVQMHLAASHIAKLLPSRYVVMGHTHEPTAQRAGDATTYVNLGHWGVDEVDSRDANPGMPEHPGPRGPRGRA